jgi:hypothetical protein
VLCHKYQKKVLALAGFETRISFVDHIDPALAAHNFAIAVAVFQRFKRASDFHRTIFRIKNPAPIRAGFIKARNLWAETFAVNQTICKLICTKNIGMVLP